MPFNSLLLVSLSTDTHFAEKSVKVSMRQEAGEKVLFFEVDQDAVRASLNMKRDVKICDGLVFYCRENERTCCFVELKGGDVGKAVKQVITTFNSLKEEIRLSLERMNSQPLLKQITWKAYICVDSNAPIETKLYKRPLNAVFGEDHCEITRERDLGKFLRKDITKHTKPSKR